VKSLLLLAALSTGGSLAGGDTWWHVDHIRGQCLSDIEPTQAYLQLRFSSQVEDIVRTHTNTMGKQISILFDDHGHRLVLKFYSNWGDCMVARDNEAPQ
jgi:hypothetical protein